MYKYEYIGDTPQILIDQHKKVEKKGDVIELDEPIDNVFFVLIPEKKKSETNIDKNKTEAGVDR